MTESTTERIRKKLKKVVESKIGSPEEVQLAEMILKSVHALKHPEKLEASLDRSIARWESEERRSAETSQG